MPLRALIVDDEPLGRESIRTLLSRDPQVTQIVEAANGTEAVQRIREGKPDVIFLDMEMPDMDGFSVLRDVAVEPLPAVVFVTAHEQYAVGAFELNALDYLLKPVTAHRFAGMLRKVKSHLNAKDSPQVSEKLTALLESLSAGHEYLRRIAVKLQHKTVFIDAEQVDWIQAVNDYVELHVDKTSYLLYANIGKFAAKLDPKLFVRVHRSLVVNTRSIQELHPVFHGEYAITLRNGTELRSGRTYHDTMKLLVSNSL